MTGQDWISISFTFVVGFFAGIYLYLTGFATTFEPPTVSENNIYEGFVITAESYGVCQEFDDCLSFQVLENGMYRAILQDGEEQYVNEDKIPLSLRTALKNNLNAVSLTRESESRSGGCYYEDDNYRFNITRDGVSYTLDTCNTSINYEGEAWESLSSLWNYVVNTGWWNNEEKVA